MFRKITPLLVGGIIVAAFAVASTDAWSGVSRARGDDATICEGELQSAMEDYECVIKVDNKYYIHFNPAERTKATEIGIELRGETDAWLSFGFPETAGKMIGSTAVISGGSDWDAGVYDLKGKSTGSVTFVGDENDLGIEEVSVETIDGESLFMEFEIPAPKDDDGTTVRKLLAEARGPKPFIWAYNASSSKKAYHGSKRGDLEIDFAAYKPACDDECEEDGTTDDDDKGDDGDKGDGAADEVDWKKAIAHTLHKLEGEKVDLDDFKAMVLEHLDIESDADGSFEAALDGAMKKKAIKKMFKIKKGKIQAGDIPEELLDDLEDEDDTIEPFTGTPEDVDWNKELAHELKKLGKKEKVPVDEFIDAVLKHVGVDPTTSEAEPFKEAAKATMAKKSVKKWLKVKRGKVSFGSKDIPADLLEDEDDGTAFTDFSVDDVDWNKEIASALVEVGDSAPKLADFHDLILTEIGVPLDASNKKDFTDAIANTMDKKSVKKWIKVNKKDRVVAGKKDIPEDLLAE